MSLRLRRVFSRTEIADDEVIKNAAGMAGRTRRKLRAVADHHMPDDLLDRAVIRSVRVLVASEVGGVQAAAFAERHARNAAERAIWAALHELELQTRDAVLEQLGDAAARFTAAQRVANTVGTANGAAVTVLPHQLQMRSLVVATKPFIPHFRKLDQHFADGPRAAFFRYVLAHELSIAELGRRVVTHDEDPLAPVETLLGNVPN
jgi:hypothetical protein